MRSPWKQVRALDADTEYLVLASSIPPTSRRSTWRMFAGARAVRKQLQSTDGVVGFSLLAQPFRRYYATLSVWRDAAALAAFTEEHPHDQLMVDLAPEMGDTKFVRWTISGSEGVPSWDDALLRLR